MFWTAFKLMEKYTTKRADRVILCEPERIEQIPFEIPSSKISVLPNIPFLIVAIFLTKDQEKQFNNNKITFSYVGGFSTDRCLFLKSYHWQKRGLLICLLQVLVTLN